MAKTLQKSTGVVTTAGGARRARPGAIAPQAVCKLNVIKIIISFEASKAWCAVRVGNGVLALAASMARGQKGKAPAPSSIGNANSLRPIRFYYFVLFQLR